MPGWFQLPEWVAWEGKEVPALAPCAPAGTAWLCLCGSVPSPLIPAKDTARQYPGRAGFWLASFGLPKQAPGPEHPIPMLACSVLYAQAPGPPAGMGGWAVSSAYGTQHPCRELHFVLHG